MRILVFLYGTLKKGHYNHRCVSMDKTAKCLFDDAFITGQMYNLGAYPAVIEGCKPIKGEVWEVDAETIERLDHLEGHPDFYERKVVDLIGGGNNLKVEAYMMPKWRLPKNATPMPVGNWPIVR